MANERKERLIEQMLRERLGGHKPPDLSRSILDRLEGEGTGPQLRVVRGDRAAPRRSHMGAKPANWRSVAAAVALIGAVGIAAAAFLLNMPRHPQTPVAGGNGATKEQTKPGPSGQAVNDNPVRANQEPAPQQPDNEIAPYYETGPSRPSGDDAPEPKPEPKPGTEPGREPQPEKPREEVEAPQTPESARPPTEVPAAPAPKALVLATLLQATEGARLAFKRAEAARYEDWTADARIESGMWLRARKPVALAVGDARVYFDGEVMLAGDDATLRIEVAGDSVYIEAYGERVFTVARGDAAFTFTQAEVVAEKSGLRLNVSCLAGEVASGGATLTAGSSASLSEKGFGRPKAEGAKLRSHPLVHAVDTIFRLVRDDLDDEGAASRVYLGVVDKGVATGKGKQAFGVKLREPLTVRDNAYVRIRLRVRNSQGISIGVKGEENADWQYFQHHTNYVINDKWITLTVPLHELRSEGKGEGKDKPLFSGAIISAFQVISWDDKSTIEIDWIEFGIDPKWK
ncbi:MAG: hypothetical protein KF696_04600 [Planctomycetes bacterium]|nr:hypothetical protein [Planctomycetota bacterium]MCW8134253.1 hypothetical protein [Planctomycetota bacterium]